MIPHRAGGTIYKKPLKGREETRWKLCRDLRTKKWDFSKQEEAAVSWLLERGFEVMLEKQYTSKDVYTVAKDGVSDEFTFPSGQKNMNVRTFMERYGENFEKKKELIKLRAEAARAVPGFKK